MMKRIFKVILKGIIRISLIAGILYGGFHLWEYSTGDWLNLRNSGIWAEFLNLSRNAAIV
jgi:hypothetical protein